MKFNKLQGLGNDFVLLDGRGGLPEALPALAEKMCHRRFGVGADGLLLLLDSLTADFQMRMLNPDGSEAEACGNGLRCLVRYIVDNGLNAADSLSIETLAGVRLAKLIRRAGHIQEFQVSMGKPIFEPSAIPVRIEPDRGEMFDMMLGNYPLTVKGRQLNLSFVSMGNPHAVMLLDEPVSAFPLEQIGPLVETDTLFPRGVNFEIGRVLDGHNIEMRVWERGAGETLACGSGACALAVASRLAGHTGNRAGIHLLGGKAEVEWDGEGEVWLTGPAETVFTGNWPG
jgi:diaminopimelate epimerase